MAKKAAWAGNDSSHQGQGTADLPKMEGLLCLQSLALCLHEEQAHEQVRWRQSCKQRKCHLDETCFAWTACGHVERTDSCGIAISSWNDTAAGDVLGARQALLGHRLGSKRNKPTGWT